MTGAERLLLAMTIVIAVALFALAARTHTTMLRLLGYWLAAAVIWAGVAYAWVLALTP